MRHIEIEIYKFTYIKESLYKIQDFVYKQEWVVIKDVSTSKES